MPDCEKVIDHVETVTKDKSTTLTRLYKIGI